MRRYLLWSVIFHTVVLTLGALIAPLRGLTNSSRPVEIVSVGLVDFATPGKVKGGSPAPKVPEPAVDEVIAERPDQKQELEELKEPEKPKPEKKKEPDKKVQANKQPKKDTTRTTSPQLASVDTGAAVSGTLAEGEGGGDVWGVETGANVNPYHRAGFASIRGNWRNPVVGPAPRKCVVKFRVMRSGAIIEVEIETKSGSDLFDRAAIRAVQITESWPPFPSHWEEDEQVIHLEFEYRP